MGAREHTKARQTHLAPLGDTDMNKAHVALTINAVHDEARLIEGWATRPEKDRVGDIVVPTGVEYKLPLPFLLDHDHSQAVGEVDHVDVSDEGIKFRAHIKKIDEPGPVKDLVDKAWQLVRHGLRRSVSIGFASDVVAYLHICVLQF